MTDKHEPITRLNAALQGYRDHGAYTPQTAAALALVDALYHFTLNMHLPDRPCDCLRCFKRITKET